MKKHDEETVISNLKLQKEIIKAFTRDGVIKIERITPLLVTIVTLLNALEALGYGGPPQLEALILANSKTPKDQLDMVLSVISNTLALLSNAEAIKKESLN